MRLRPPQISTRKIARAIAFIRHREKQRTRILEGKSFYLKPDWIPWRKEVWVTQRDIFLPCDFNSKTEIRAAMDVHRSICLLEEIKLFLDEHGKLGFMLWVCGRKTPSLRQACNTRIRKLWRIFLSKTRL